MTTPANNPFVLPGMGQGPGGNPLAASMEMMRQAWSSLAGAGGLAQSMTMTPPLSLEELERRIAELRTVESWLQMNLSLLSSSIQGLEVQRATISTLRAFADGMSATPPGQDPSPLEVLLGLRQAKGGDDGQGKAPAPGPEAPAPQAEASPASAPDSVAAASQAWWNLLQQQFDQIAAATAASMPQTGAMQGDAPQSRSSDAAQGKAAAPDDARKGSPAGASQEAAPTARRTAGKATGSRSASSAPAARKRAAARKRGAAGSSSS